VNKLLLLLLSSQIVLSNECVLINNGDQQAYKFGQQKLSVFWSQQYSGSDLVKEEIRDISWAQEKVNISLFDGGFERDHINVSAEVTVDPKFSSRRKLTGHHGTSVANIINGPGQYGVTERANYISLRNVRFASTIKSEFEKYSETGVYPEVISNSYGWSDNELIQHYSRVAEDEGVFWFLASGNDHPKDVAEVENDSGAILIGSYAPSGLQSSFSQISENVVVLSPADDMQASIDGKGEHTEFGGTSGATPLVAGHAINIISLLPELTKNEYIHLLKKTSLKSFEQVNMDPSMPGLFNGYKSFKVALKIASHCRAIENELDSECVSREILNEDNYIFGSDSNSVTYEQIMNSGFPCRDRKSAFKELRKRTLLTSGHTEWKTLKDVYLALGYEKNAEFAKNMEKGFTFNAELKQEMEKNALLSVGNQRYFDSYFRYDQLFGYKYQMGLASMLVFDTSVDAYWVSSFLIRFGKNLDQRVVEYLKSSLKYAREEVVADIEAIIYQ